MAPRRSEWVAGPVRRLFCLIIISAARGLGRHGIASFVWLSRILLSRRDENRIAAGPEDELGAVQHLRERVTARISLLKPYERRLSAMSMAGGFAFDNYAFGRVDHPATQIVLAVYVLVAATTIAVLHGLESRVELRPANVPWRTVLSAGTQFALGGLWSAFLIFYSRSAVISASWPFLLVLAGVLIGNEIFRAYHSRLVFTAILFFFALFSYTIFALPVFTRTIGTNTFLLSGAFAVAGFVLFLYVLDRLDSSRFREASRNIALGAGAVFLGLNLFYFTNLLPPLPLALSDAGIYHSVKRTGAYYTALAEPQSWDVNLGVPPAMHVARGESLSLYSAVFAPIDLKTKIAHRWQRYDAASNRWITESSVSFSITGGRGEGYRAYSIKSNPRAGSWRVDIDTVDGRLIGRVQFSVAAAAVSVPTQTKILQ